MSSCNFATKTWLRRNTNLMVFGEASETDPNPVLEGNVAHLAELILPDWV